MPPGASARFPPPFPLPLRSRWLLGAVTALAATLLAGCGSTPDALQEKVAANVAEADRQYVLGNQRAARAWYDRAVAIDPATASTYLGTDDGPGPGVAQSTAGNNDWSDQAQLMQRAVRLPALAVNAQIWDALAVAQAHLGDAADARASYGREYKLLAAPVYVKGMIIPFVDPYTRELALTNAQWYSGDRASARASFRRLIVRYPQQVASTRNDFAYADADSDASTPEDLPNAKLAVHAAEYANADQSAIASYLDTLGWVEYRAGRYPDAARDMENALRLSPLEQVSYYHLAVIESALGERGEALATARHAAALSPSDAATQAILAQTQKRAAA